MGPSHDAPLERWILARSDEFLAHRVLAPLEGLTPAARERLTTTLRSWLLHQGRCSAVAEHLGIHPQTVRCRMSQVRERDGDTLDDPSVVLTLMPALAVDVPGATGIRSS